MMINRIPGRAILVGALMTGAMLAFNREPIEQLTAQLGKVREAVTSEAFAADSQAAGAQAGWRDPYVYYAPISDLGKVDGQVLDQAKQRIDMAAFTISDFRVIDGLLNAALRGVKIRLYMDATQYTQFRSRGDRDVHAFNALITAPNIEMKTNGPGASWMHLKGYVVDGQVLRSGSANFTYSGEREQDNDLVLLPNADAIASFQRNFEIMWNRGNNQAVR